MDKSKPVGLWCPIIEDAVGWGRCEHLESLHTPVYIATTIRKAWEEFANWIGTDPYKRSMREVAIEARRRAKKW